MPGLTGAAIAASREPDRSTEAIESTSSRPPSSIEGWEMIRPASEGLPPPGSDPGEADPEETIRRAQLGPGRCSLAHGELVTQGDVFQGEPAMAAAEEREEW
jgi:hypothetical protein